MNFPSTRYADPDCVVSVVFCLFNFGEQERLNVGYQCSGFFDCVGVHNAAVVSVRGWIMDLWTSSVGFIGASQLRGDIKPLSPFHSVMT